jgi:HAD superfamily hydrolase (TIGR01509 family)
VLVIFDCDGVLVDSEPLSNRALAEALTAIGRPHTTEECVEKFMGRSWSTCVEILGGVPEGLAEDYRARMSEAFERELTTVPGVVEAIDALPDWVQTCVASSGGHEKIRFSLGLTGLLERFEGRIFSAADVERGKPAPDLFLHAAGRCGVTPGQCVVVEDSPVGIEAAKAAGMRVMGYAGRTPVETLLHADVVFASMDDLPELLLAVEGVRPA